MTCSHLGVLLEHTCLFLWSEYQLKDNRWAQIFFTKYFVSALNQLDWSKLEYEFPELTSHINPNMMQSFYWRTRNKKEDLYNNVANHITAIAIDEGYHFLMNKLLLF